MNFVKLSPRILRSTLWDEDSATRLVFMTGLCLAEPWEFEKPMQAYRSFGAEPIEGMLIPPGWYGFIRASGNAIIREARVDEQEGRKGLEKLSEPDPLSASKEFDGRRIVRVDGGFVVLNFFKYRDRDTTAADRMRRLRARQKGNVAENSEESVTRDGVTRNVTATEGRVQSTESQSSELQSTGKSKAKPKAHGFAVPPWIPSDSWVSFAEMRRKLRKPLTDRAAELLVKKLEKLKAEGQDVAAVLDQSVERGWSGVFALGNTVCKPSRHIGFDHMDYTKGTEGFVVGGEN